MHIKSIKSLQCQNLLDICNQGRIFQYIDNDNKEHIINKYKFQYYFAQGKYSLKVEGLENYFKQYLPKSVHLFVSPKNSKSFKLHKDPLDLIIKVIYGKKTMIVEDSEVLIEDELFIKANTPHTGSNRFDSVTLSIADGDDKTPHYINA